MSSRYVTLQLLVRLSANNSGQQVTTMSRRSAIERTNLHLNPLGSIVSPSKEYGVICRIVFDIEVDVPATVVPPSSIVFSLANLYCAVTATFIVIIVICTKLLAIEGVSCKWVSRSDASKATNSQWILISSTSYFKHIVVKVGSGLVLKFKIYPELPLASLGKTVHVFEAVPEFSIEISKSFLVVTPWSVEIYRAIFPSLYHCPSSICCLSITENTCGTPYSSTPTLHLVNTRSFISKKVKIIGITTSFDGNVIDRAFLLDIVSCSV